MIFNIDLAKSIEGGFRAVGGEIVAFPLGAEKNLSSFQHQSGLMMGKPRELQGLFCNWRKMQGMKEGTACAKTLRQEEQKESWCG